MTRSRSRSRDRSNRRNRPTSPARRRRHHSTTPSPPPRSKMRSDIPEHKPASKPSSALSRISSVHNKPRHTAVKISPEMSALQERVKRDLLTDDAAADRKFLASGSLTRCEKGYIFKGPEFDDISAKELRKIQIDIRRNIPAHRVSDDPIRRRIADPVDVVTPRGKTEGAKPVFTRDDVLLWLPDITEEKTVQLLNDENDGKKDQNRGDRRRRSPSPRMRSERRRTKSRSRSPLSGRGIKARLGNNGDIKSRLGGGGGNRDRENRDRTMKDSSVKDRLGDKDRVLDRQELESQRPIVNPWDDNPEYVPRGRAYFEHDSREDQGDGGGDDRFQRGGRGNWRGGRISRSGFRGDFNGRRGGGGGFGRGFNNDRNHDRNHDRFSNNRGDRDRFGNNDRFGYQQRGGNFNSRRRGRSPSPEWKHDKFNENDQEEAMTT